MSPFSFFVPPSSLTHRYTETLLWLQVLFGGWADSLDQLDNLFKWRDHQTSWMFVGAIMTSGLLFFFIPFNFYLMAHGCFLFLNQVRRIANQIE